MRVALYHPWVYLKSGIERSFVELLRGSRHEWVIYTHHFAPETTYPELANAPVVQLTPGVSVKRSLLPLLAASAKIARTRLPDDGAKALLVSSEGLGDFVLARAEVPAVGFCHTPLKILHDPIAAQRLREQNALKWALSRALGPAFTAADRRMWRRYRHVFANSEETRRRIGAARLRAADDVEVLHPGVDLERFTGHPDEPAGKGFLVAGRIMWQKQIETAIEAIRILDTNPGGAPSLTIAGTVDEKSKPYLAHLRSLAAGLPITFELDPSDTRLAGLYRTARALIFTPPNEDWGMVPLEAMASATPVIAPDCGGPRESVVHGGSGWLIEASATAYAERIAAVVAMSDAELRVLRRGAREQAERFGWKPFVERIDDVMDRVASHP